MKDTFILKTAWKGVFDDLNDRQAGILIKAVFTYIATGDKPELTDTELKMAFRFMQLDIDVFAEKYKTQVRTNMENGKKGGNPNFEKGKPNPYYKKDNPKITQITDHNPNETETDSPPLPPRGERKVWRILFPAMFRLPVRPSPQRSPPNSSGTATR